MLHMLRREMGDEAFWKGLAAYYARFRNGNALTDDFRRVMEEVSGRPLDVFFREWVYTPGQPRIEARWSYANGVLTVRVEQTQAPGPVFATPLDIGIVTDRSALARVETVPLAERAQTFTFRVDKAPVDVVLDPNTWLLATFGAVERQGK